MLLPLPTAQIDARECCELLNRARRNPPRTSFEVIFTHEDGDSASGHSRRAEPRSNCQDLHMPLAIVRLGHEDPLGCRLVLDTNRVTIRCRWSRQGSRCREEENESSHGREPDR